MAGKKVGWGWASTILTVAAVFSGQAWMIPLIAAAAITGFAESQHQQRQAKRAYKKAFGAIGDNALAGSPTYSWDGPQTVSDPSLPVPLCYGEVTVGGNIINAWTETVNIYMTKWETITPTQIDTPWANFTNIIRIDNTSRGIKIKFKEYTITTADEWATINAVSYKISYKVTGGSSWIVAHASVVPHRKNEPIIINPERNLINRQYDIKIEVIQTAGIPSNSFTYLTNLVYYDTIYSAHENAQDTENVAGHKDLQYLTIALAEGEIQSADETSVTLNDNPLNNYGKDYYTYDYTLGSNSQVSNPIFDNIVTENSVSYKAIANDSSPFILTTQNQDVQSLILILSFPYGLYQIVAGKFAAWQTDFTISYRKVGDTPWLTTTKIIKIKNNNPFKQAIKIDVSEGQYEVKIVKTSADPDGIVTIGEAWWVGTQEYVSQAQHFPNTAVAYLSLQATDQSSGSIPNAKFKIKGKLVEVPKLTIGGTTVPYYLTYWNGTNYVLDAAWNGNAIGTVCTDASLFVSQWTNNPIWCLRDLINNDYYGLRSYFQSTLNDTDLRLLAKYCDEKVNDGKGSTDKRFKLDIVIDSQDDARNVIERILSTFRGFSVWAENQFKIKINKTENPVQLFTMGNIIENSLSINYSSATDRFNVAKITYPDQNDVQARMSEVMIYDVPLGGMERVQTFNLIGITRRSQAVRMGRFFLNQAKYIKESIQFKAGLDSIACEAGDVIEFSHDVTGYGLASGRIKASTINSITIDTPISIDTLKTYKVKVKLADDTIEERTVHNTNSIPPYTLVMTSNFTSVPPVDSIYAFGETGVITKPYRVLSINRDSIQERQITAIEDNVSIYSDTGDAIEPINYSSLKNPLRIPDSVTNLTLKELTVDPGDGSKINTILVSWNPPTLINDPSILPIVITVTTGGSIAAGTYYCKYSWIGEGGETLVSSGAPIVTTGSTSTITVTIPSFSQGVTSARVYVGTTSGQEKYQGQIITSAGSLILTTIPLTGNAIPLTNSTQNDTNYDRAKVYISDSAGAFWEYSGEGRSNFIIENVDKLAYRIAVVSLSLYGIAQSISDAAYADITILGKATAPSNVTFQSVDFGALVVFKWVQIADKDLAYYEIRTEDLNWGTSNSNLIYQGLGDTFTWQNPLLITYTFYIKARDTSGNYSITAGSSLKTNSIPTLGAITIDFTGKDCYVKWSAIYDNDLKEYKVFIYSDSNRTILLRSASVQDPQYVYRYESNLIDTGGVPLRTLYLTVKAIDLLNQEGIQNIIASNVAPVAPTGLIATPLFAGIWLTWNASTDPDIRYYYIYVNDIFKDKVTSPTYIFSGADIQTQYGFKVSAVDTFGEGGISTNVNATTLSIESAENLGAVYHNYLRNPSAEDDQVGWTGFDANITVQAGGRTIDSKCFRIAPAGSVYVLISSFPVETNPSEQWYFSGWIKTAGVTNGNGRLQVVQYGASYNLLVTSQYMIQSSYPTGWTKYFSTIITLDTACKYIEFRCQVDAGNTGQWYFDDLELRAIIIGDMIAANSIYASNIKIGQVFVIDEGGTSGIKMSGKIQSITGVYNYWDLDTGNFSLGKTSASHFKVLSDGSGFLGNNKVSWDVNGNVSIIGTLSIGSSGFANLSDRTADNLLEGTTYKKYAATEQTKLGGIEPLATVGAQTSVNLKNDAGSTLTQAAIVTAQGTSADTTNVNGVAAATVQGGAARANTGLDSSGNVLTKILPASTIGVPGSAGLYLGSDYMGYYNGGWKSVITNTGQFYFGNGTIAAPGTDNYIYWNGSTLAIRGDLVADDITAGGTITGNTIKTAGTGARIELESATKEARWYNSSGVQIASIGDENIEADWSFIYLNHTPSDEPGIYLGQANKLDLSSRTTSGHYSYGHYSYVTNTQSGTYAFGVVGAVPGSNGVRIGVFGDGLVGGWFNGFDYDLLLGPWSESLSGVAKIAGFNGYITIADTNTTPIARRIPSGVFGSVNGTSTPSVKRGEGFTVSRVSAGNFTITFTNAFAVAPVVVATSAYQNSGIIRVDTELPGSFKVYIQSYSGTGLDQDFNFFAMANV